MRSTRGDTRSCPNSVGRRKARPMLIARLPRTEFLRCYFSYEPAEHVAFWEPTQQGKTHLMYQMLDIAMLQNPQLSVASLMPKSVDPATRHLAVDLGLKITDQWPP